jgi:hypothetical protein
METCPKAFGGSSDFPVDRHDVGPPGQASQPADPGMYSSLTRTHTRSRIRIRKHLPSDEPG